MSMWHLKKLAGWFLFSVSFVVLARIVALNALSYLGRYTWGWSEFWAQTIMIFVVAVFFYLWHFLSIQGSK